MTLLAPLAALFGLTIPVILALYFLKVRRPPVVLSSTLLWRRLIRDRQANAPWQRLRFSWLLLLQLLAVLLLVAALTRPALPRTSSLAAHTIVVLDASASMQTTDVKPSRFEAARAEARDLIGRMGPQDRLSLIWMGPQARMLASTTGDQGPLRSALDLARVSNGGADLQQALALAAAAAGSQGAGTRLVLLSDGITNLLRSPIILPFDVEYRPIGVSAENLAITALVVRSEPERSGFVHVQNFGRERHHTSVEWRADGRLLDAKAIDLDPGTGRDLTFAVPLNSALVTATLSPSDLLALDDIAYGIARPTRVFKATLVTAGNLFLERALRLRADLKITIQEPKDYKPDPQADLFIFDTFLPRLLPTQPFWLLNPPEDARLQVGGFYSPGRVRPATVADPLLAGIDLRDVHVARARDLRGAHFGRALIETDLGPLVLVREEPVRAVLSGFELHESDLPLRAAFPLLVDHLSTFMLPQAVAPHSYAPDEPVLISLVQGVDQARVIRPDGRVVTLAAGGGTRVFADTDQTGLYRVEQRRGSETLRADFVVNAFAPERSAIAPQAHLALAGSAVSGQTVPLRHGEIWTWLALLALAVLTGEWWVFHRGL
jgi:hypothetical protein